MIDYFAARINAAHAWTRISAVLIEASQMTFAIPIDDAFGLATVHIRITHERRHARTLGYAIDRRANGVLATR